jgi:DNA-nicking Smr family endonuclease
MEKLDLHGIRHADAKQEVIQFIERNWATLEALEIITGHSETMKTRVITVLEEYNLSYNIGSLFDAQAPKIIIWGFE